MACRRLPLGVREGRCPTRAKLACSACAAVPSYAGLVPGRHLPWDTRLLSATPGVPVTSLPVSSCVPQCLHVRVVGAGRVLCSPCRALRQRVLCGGVRRTAVGTRQRVSRALAFLLALPAAQTPRVRTDGCV